MGGVAGNGRWRPFFPKDRPKVHGDRPLSRAVKILKRRSNPLATES